VAGPFAGTSEDRPPRVWSPISPPVLAGCARSEGPIVATRGGKPSEVERGPATALRPPILRGDGEKLLDEKGKGVVHSRRRIAFLLN